MVWPSFLFVRVFLQGFRHGESKGRTCTTAAHESGPPAMNYEQHVWSFYDWIWEYFIYIHMHRDSRRQESRSDHEPLMYTCMVLQYWQIDVPFFDLSLLRSCSIMHHELLSWVTRTIKISCTCTTLVKGKKNLQPNAYYMELKTTLPATTCYPYKRSLAISTLTSTSTSC